MKKLTFPFLFFIVILCLFFAPPFASATTQISLNIPGGPNAYPTSTGPGGFVANFYQFALMIGGVLALGIIVYGGVRYMASAGNPSGQSDAKEWIEAALLGLLLLVGAYFILNVINPQLLNLKLPTLTSVNISSTPSGAGGVASGGGTPPAIAGAACPGPTCATLPNCTPSSHTSCGAAPAMETVVNCINAQDPNFTVNEGYPPTPPGTQHSDPGHNTGCAIDVHVSTANNCAAVTQFAAAAKSCGVANPLNEYGQCTIAVPPPKTYAHTSGGNIHIDAPKGKGNGC
jgi:hypothetical protein